MKRFEKYPYEKTSTITEEILFSENQRFRQPWLRLIIMLPILISLFVLIYRLTNKRPVPDLHSLLFGIIIGIVILFLFSVVELRTKVTKSAICIKFFPFHTKWLCFSFKEIDSFSNVTYNPLIEYGGWGIRYGVNGKAYNVSGNQGIRLVFKNGKKLLIGSREPDQFASAIQNAMMEKMQA